MIGVYYFYDIWCSFHKWFWYACSRGRRLNPGRVVGYTYIRFIYPSKAVINYYVPRMQQEVQWKTPRQSWPYFARVALQNAAQPNN